MTEHGHIVSAFEHEIEGLKSKIMQMGGLAERLLTDAISALLKRDAELAGRVVAADQRIDALESEVDEEAVLVVARRQPMAVDLREIMAAIRIAADLERIGDLAKNVAKRAIAIGAETQPQKVSLGVDHMADLALAQLKDVLDAYVARDAAKALSVRSRDAELDALYNSLFRELLTYMMEDPRSITMSTHLLFCAKNIERVGDHTTNIAETVYYIVKGQPLRDERPKGDATSYTAVPYPPAAAEPRS